MTAEIILDDHPLISQINQLAYDLPNLQAMASKVIVDSQEGVKNALSLTARVKTRLKEIEDLRKTLNEPARKSIALVNEASKEISTALETIETTLKAKLLAWQRQLEVQSEAAKQATEKLKETLGIEVDVFLDAPKTLSNADAIASTKIKLSFEVEDIKLIPLQFLMIDEEKIKKAIKMGLNIPGIKVIETKELQVRRR